jgi:hypothetical protein
MLHLWVVDGGDGLQMWRVVTNIWNSSCGKLTRDGPLAWG